MTTYIFRRILIVIPVLIGVSILSFFFVRLIPGDPVRVMLGERARPADVQQYKAQMGLDQPIYIQYIKYMEQMFKGNLGQSIVTRVPVAKDISYRLPATIEAIFFALLLGIVLGIAMGIVAALKRNTIVDTGASLVALTGVSMPVFWLALILIYFFGVNLKILPPGARLDAHLKITQVTGFYLIDSLLMGRLDIFWNVIKHMILPSFVLSTTVMPSIMRLTRASMLEVLQKDYIRTARAKGLAMSKVVLKHTLRNALLPVITVIGLQVSGLLGGAILTENAFSWTGMGSWFYGAIVGRDYPVIQTAILLNAVIFVLMTMLVDISYAFIDPRIRYK
ncbi:MAG: ABC transporter permease [Chloroflexi bacterium]|nr:ABC transporter permease [Chloroflexota bacterium]